jgi:hypothetical protein
MELDESAAADKRRTIREAATAARRTLQVLPDDRIDSAVEAFSRVTPPEEPELTIGLVTISSLYTTPKAQSRKPGNIVLNWRKLIDIVPDVSLASLGAATLPIAPAWSVVLVGLYVWNKIWDKIAEADGFEKVNELRTSYSLPPLTLGQFTSVIDRLVQIDCVELEEGVIWLREWVRVKYS